jgi:hypothetical protein
LGSKIESRIWAFWAIDILISRPVNVNLTINQWSRASCAPYGIERWYLSGPAEGREPLEFYKNSTLQKRCPFEFTLLALFWGISKVSFSSITVDQILIIGVLDFAILDYREF